jgi:hypothetical protein
MDHGLAAGGPLDIAAPRSLTAITGTVAVREQDQATSPEKKEKEELTVVPLPGIMSETTTVISDNNSQ